MTAAEPTCFSQTVASSRRVKRVETASRVEARRGVAFAVATYTFWGVLPLYFKALVQVPATEVLAHRVFWSFVLFAFLLPVLGRWQSVVEALSARGTRRMLAASALLIGTSWFTFIWGTTHDLVLQLSLAYFICPLVNVALGFAFLRERLSGRQTLSVLLAAGGVVYLSIAQGALPILALVHAGAFGAYGLLRKVAKVDSISGLAVELTLLLPAAALYLIYLVLSDQMVFGAVSLRIDLLLAMTCFVTAVPLVGFVCAARRLRLTTLGLLQYITPSMHFLMAVVVFGEPFTVAHLITFGCIWTALAVYSIDAARASSGAKCSYTAGTPACGWGRDAAYPAQEI
jgi:chloramphenicol-sensitive protein RarD